MKHLKLLSVLLVSILILNCSSDDDNSAPESTTHQLLMSGKWFLKSQTGEILNDCDKQTYQEFINEDNLIMEHFYKSMTDQCISEGPASMTYMLINNNEKLLIREGAYSTVLYIDSISETTLSLSFVIGNEISTSIYEK